MGNKKRPWSYDPRANALELLTGSCYQLYAPEEGLEPPTWWLTATRSTN